ncbi:MAG: shikimate dehydrogenase [Candidatus Bathyarchaeia archaeon]
MPWISAKTRIFGVIGDPIEHSLSPIMHNVAFRSLKMDCIYLAFRVRKEELDLAIKGMRCLGIAGFNVTMPHKVDIINYLDDMDELAREIGSVNTVVNRCGKLIGFNTDGIGAFNAITHVVSDSGSKKVVVFGAGGAARALIYHLSKLGKEIVILNRTEERAIGLAKEMREKTGGNIRGAPLSKTEEELVHADIVVNATPVGSWPHIEETLVNKKALRKDMVVMDMVYAPLETRLLREAKEVGATIVDGITMLVHQGAASFKIWTGEDPPIDLMKRAAFKFAKRRLLK